MHKNPVELLLKKAEACERKYHWVQAAGFYEEAVNLVLKQKDSQEAAKFFEKLGSSYFKAALRAQSNAEFRKNMKKAVKTYENQSEQFELAGRRNQLEINHANASIAYTKAWLEKSRLKKKQLLSTWWTLENQVLEEYERKGDLHSVSKVCNNLIGYSPYDRFFLASSFSERKRMYEECINLAEKAIQILLKLDDEYELAKAYCYASWYYAWSPGFWESDDKILQINKKTQDYSKKALELASKMGDAWLISWSSFAGWNSNSSVHPNPLKAMEYSEKALKFGKISKDNFEVGFGYALTSASTLFISLELDDPDKQKECIKKSIGMAQKAIQFFEIIHCVHALSLAYAMVSSGLTVLASIEPNLETQQKILEESNRAFKEKAGLIRGWKSLSSFSQLINNYLILARIKPEIEEKKDFLQKAHYQIKKGIAYQKELHPYGYTALSNLYFSLCAFQFGSALIEPNPAEYLKLLVQAVVSMEKSLQLQQKRPKIRQSSWGSSYNFGRRYNLLGKILQKIYSVTKNEKRLKKAVESYSQAVLHFEKAKMSSRVAESRWHLGQVFDQAGKYQNAWQNYESAAKAYNQTAEKIPQLKQFYRHYSLYMQAWSQIVQAKNAHSIEEYEEAQEYYERAAELHELTEQWSYLSPNYSAWANMEEAESLSRNENTQQAKNAFQKALKQFATTEVTIKQKLEKTTAPDEKEMLRTLSKASDLRRKYCQTRILMEDAKLLDREGNYRQSSKCYGEAAKNISAITEKTEVEAERKELEYLAVLCQAWEKMAVAEERTSSEKYLKAAEFFEKAKEYCYTRKASLWVLGNSNFCKGLAAGTRFQGSMDLKDNALAKRYIKSAASNYLQAGFKSASEYAKATQRLFDAYVFISQAENEVNPENKTKQYQMAEKLLQISADSFTKAKQPEKTAQVQQILNTVGEEKELAASLNQVLHAPALTSSMVSFTAPTPTSETSVGLESFEHANVRANLVVGLKEIRIGESFCLSVEFVNAGKEPALLTKVEDFVPPGFAVVKKPEIYRLEDSCLNMKGKQIAPLKLVEAKVVLQPSKKGLYQLNPKVHYLDENGQNKSLQLKSVEIKVEEVILANRVSTGTKELDALLLGGVPEEYAVALTGPPSDERELIIGHFLGAGEGQTSFYVATEASGLENLLMKPNFYLFLCNPKPKVKVPDLPNIYKLHGKADINNLNIALLQAYRTVQKSSSKRICINIVSDVLANYTVKTARKWIAELTTDLISKGFTILGVINPLVHTSEELNNLLELFDGEINLTQTEDPLERKKVLIVKKLRNQDYIRNPIFLSKRK